MKARNSSVAGEGGVARFGKGSLRKTDDRSFALSRRQADNPEQGVQDRLMVSRMAETCLFSIGDVSEKTSAFPILAQRIQRLRPGFVPA